MDFFPLSTYAWFFFQFSVIKFELRVFENRIIRRIFRPKTGENEEWRRLHNEELHGLYRSYNIFTAIKSRRLRWEGHVARMEEGRSAFKILTGKPAGKGPRCRWEDSIRMGLIEIGINTTNWIDSVRIWITSEPL